MSDYWRDGTPPGCEHITAPILVELRSFMELDSRCQSYQQAGSELRIMFQVGLAYGAKNYWLPLMNAGPVKIKAISYVAVFDLPLPQDGWLWVVSYILDEFWKTNPEYKHWRVKHGLKV